MMANMVLERNHHSLEDVVVKEMMMALMENIHMEEKEVKTTVMMALAEVAQETTIPQAELDQKMINLENLVTNGETVDQNLAGAVAVMMAPMMEGVKDLLVQEVMDLDQETETKAHYLVNAEAHLLMMTPSMAEEKMVPAEMEVVMRIY